MVGKTLSHYEILAPLGAGGMGEVYLARDTTLERDVAIKVLPDDLAADPDRVARFEREARAIAALEHPNVVTVHSVEEVDGVRFLTMEFVKGTTLADELRGGALVPRRIFEIAVPLAEGLAAAHGAGVIHRDLKPANVMLTGDGRVKILDFGLAKLRADMSDPDASRMPTEAVTEEGRILGTVAYMSPEQVKGQPADERSDIFSTGVVLYEIATGLRPFRGDTWADVSSSIIRDSPPLVTDLNRELPGHLGRIVRRCLEKDPGRRYQSAIELRNDLADLARETELRASASVTTSPAGGPGWLAAAAAAAATVTLALVAWMVLQNGGGTPSSAEQLAASIRSIAVLPFDNLSGDPEDQFFIDGMQDALITELSKTDLRVIAQSSAMQFRQTELSLPEIAAELDVGGLVEGAVLRADDQVRVSVRLVHGPSDLYLWGDRYDRSLTDVLVLTAELAKAISNEVELAMTPGQQRRLAGARRVDPAAWELYARGMHHVNRFTAADFVEARRLLTAALEIDPEFALAWAGLAMAYGTPAATLGIPDPQLVEGAWRSVDRALELDPDLGDAHAVRGTALLWLEWDWEAAERALQLALDLKPNSSIARHGYADLLVALGRAAEGVEQTRLGRQYDPLSRLSNLAVVSHLVLARRYEESIAEYRNLRERLPDVPEHSSWVASAYWGMGRFEEAVAQSAETLRLSGEAEVADALMSGFESGGAEAAARAVAEIVAASPSADDSALSLALWYGRAGDTEATLDWLERAYQLPIPGLPVQLGRHEFDLVRDHPRYASLVQRLNLPR